MKMQFISVEYEGAIAILRLKRAEKRNAIHLEMLSEILTACDHIEANNQIRVGIITGVGTAFSAGGDIHAWSAMSAHDFGVQWVRLGHRVFERLATLRMPLIAAINGHAFGGGLELAASADIRIGEHDSLFGLPEASLGMVPGWSGTQRLVKRFGAQIVRRMALGGEVLSAQSAHNLGMIDQVAANGEALTQALSYAQTIAQRAPAALETIKLMIAVANDEDKGEAVETLGSILIAGTQDLKAGVDAFKNKNQAVFEGKW